MSSNLKYRIAELQKDLKALDDQFADYRRDRERYAQAIAALQGDANGSGSPLKTNIDRAIEQSKPFDSGKLDKKEVVDLAVENMPQKFTTSDVRQFIAEHYPTVAPDIRGSYLPTRLSALVKKQKIKLSEKGEGGPGGPNAWVKT